MTHGITTRNRPSDVNLKGVTLVTACIVVKTQWRTTNPLLKSSRCKRSESRRSILVDQDFVVIMSTSGAAIMIVMMLVLPQHNCFDDYDYDPDTEGDSSPPLVGGSPRTIDAGCAIGYAKLPNGRCARLGKFPQRFLN